MITLATQLVERQSGDYDPSDLEDRYESRMRTMLDAKIAGQAVQPGTAPVPLDSNVINLMGGSSEELGWSDDGGAANRDGTDAGEVDHASGGQRRYGTKAAGPKASSARREEICRQSGCAAG